MRDVLRQGLTGDLVHSRVGDDLGTRLQSAVTSDVSDGVAPADVMEAIREECGGVPLAYVRVIELVVLAGLAELQVIVGLPRPEIGPQTPEPGLAPPRRATRRRR